MASQDSPFPPERRSSNTVTTNAGLSTLSPTRRNTSSSIGSTNPIPPGTWTLNISGNCSSCHHRHEAVTIQVRASSVSDHVGEIHCEHCDKLWLGFGRRNSTRISLVSTETIEIAPIEREYRSALVNLVRSATAGTAVASPGLAAIPESSTTSPSQEPSVRTAFRSGIRRVRSTSTYVPVATDTSSSGNNVDYQSPHSPIVPRHLEGTASPNSRHTSGRPAFFARLQQKVRRFSTLHNSRIERLLNLRIRLRTSHAEQGELSVQPVMLNTTVPGFGFITSPVPIIESQPQETQPRNYASDRRSNTSILCGPSANSAQDLGFLQSLDRNVLEEMSSEQRIAWMRERLTSFKDLQPRQQSSNTRSAMVSTATQADLDAAELMSLSPVSPSPHGTLNGFGSHLMFGSDAPRYLRSLNLSDIDVPNAIAVEGNLVTSASISASPPILPGNTHGTYQAPGSLRPLSLDSIRSIVQRWHEVNRDRVQNRSSWDSATTGGIASITFVRETPNNRRSFQSMTLGSTLVGTEPSSSQVQLPTTDEDSLDDNQYPSPPPPPAN